MGVDVEKYAYYVNKLRQNVALETWKLRQIVTWQTAHKCPPYDPEPKPPWKFSAYATERKNHFIIIELECLFKNVLF